MEILFRGKRVDNGGWVYGDFYRKWGVTGIVYDYMISTRDGMTYPVIPETVGQYTWIDDRSGVKIFDGDICKMHYFFENHVGFGVFEDEAEITCRITITTFGLRFEGDGTSWYLHEYVEEPGEELEVIGIHDNPELLDG